MPGVTGLCVKGGGASRMGAVLSVRKNTSKGGRIVAVKVSGKIVYVKPEKTEKGHYYKRLQLFSESNGHPATLESVTDMSNQDWQFGANVDLEVSLQVYQGKKGLAYSFTHWGNQGGGQKGKAYEKDEKEVTGAVNNLPPVDGSGAGGGAKSAGGKFGG